MSGPTQPTTQVSDGLPGRQLADASGANAVSADPAAKHTPGPWRAGLGHNGQHEVRGPGSAAVATAYHTPDGLGAANADLIAAAPNLRERLQAIIDWADFALRNPAEFDSEGVRNLDGPVFDEARELLSALSQAAA